jgi:hypothetical protein
MPDSRGVRPDEVAMIDAPTLRIRLANGHLGSYDHALAA